VAEVTAYSGSINERLRAETARVVNCTTHGLISYVSRPDWNSRNQIWVIIQKFNNGRY